MKDNLPPLPRRTATLLAVLCALAITLAGTLPSLGDEFVRHVFTNAAGAAMPYRLLEPGPGTGDQKYPLVLFFHGAGERGTDNEKQLVHGTRLFLVPENLKAFPCFVLAPQCPEEQQWVDMPWGTESGDRPVLSSKSMNLALQILDTIVRDHPVDTNRIYVTGLSMGGFGAWDCITRFPERFAAAVPVCGGGDEKSVTAQVARVPVWAFHSDDDKTVKVTRTRHMIDAMQSAGGLPKYTEYTGLGHNSWDSAYAENDLLSWLFAHRLTDPNRRSSADSAHSPATH